MAFETVLSEVLVLRPPVEHDPVRLLGAVPVHPDVGVLEESGGEGGARLAEQRDAPQPEEGEAKKPSIFPVSKDVF